MSVYKTQKITTNADMFTPVAIYANLRQMFPETLLLECADSSSPENACSYICADSLAKFWITEGSAKIEFAGRKTHEVELNQEHTAIVEFNNFQASLKINFAEEGERDLIGLFGYFGFSSIPFLEDIKFDKKPDSSEQIPDAQFVLYRYVFRFDHFHNSLTVIKLCEESNHKSLSLNELLEKITRRRAPEFPFAREGDEKTDLTDAEFAEIIEKCQTHIQRGDVFQIVPSRRFTQSYRGDEFAVYRALRRINPSPFLFFFDFGNFTLFGSSPEAQLLVRDRFATIFTIAGTYPRGANAIQDNDLAERLAKDPKENAEHTMLVDLARNDLSRNCRKVHVESFKLTEFYSHVIHLVSRVCGEMNSDVSVAQILADTFPAGTLSGAPKYRAMQILNEIEPSARSFYGGSVGFFDFNGNCTQAIMIRSFLARQRKLFFQAGAGIVSDSIPANETAEVNNKLAALRRAVETAETI